MFFLDLIRYCIQPFFYFLLRSLGWKVPSVSEMRGNKVKYGIYVFSHTSKTDFFLSALYQLAQPEYGKNSYVLLMPGIFNKYTTPILNWLRFLKATHSKDKGAGLVNQIVEISKKTHQLCLGLSPEGTLVASEWKGGYYWIAKGIAVEMPEEKVVLRVTGFDYLKKELAFHGFITIESYDRERYLEMSLEERQKEFKEEKNRIQNYLQNEMAKMTPLFPEKSFVKPNCDLTGINLTRFNYVKFILCLTMLLFPLLNYRAFFDKTELSNDIRNIIYFFLGINYCINDNMVYFPKYRIENLLAAVFLAYIPKYVI